MAWTNDQLKAINIDNRTILTSAGAGSGKTAVLTERVITKIKNGCSINHLLILTFTNLAALEMKNRIRNALKSNIIYKEELDKLDSSYITTFDSFSLSMVKKYHYLLNIDSNISICSEAIILAYTIKAIDEIFDDLYKEENANFLKFISTFCTKDDSLIKKNIYSLYNTYYRSKINILKTLENDKNRLFDEIHIKSLQKKFERIIVSNIKSISDDIDELYSYADNSFDSILNFKELIIKNNALSDLINILKDYKSYFPNKNKKCTEEYSDLKAKIFNKIKEILKYEIYTDYKQFEKEIILSNPFKNVIIDILIKLDNKINKYKKENNLYTFNDIARLCIKLFEENPSALKEISDEFSEIMIDEYQDTSDIQERLINLISKNNVYYVGDVKQSIYRFRNANPQLFMEKYNSYKNSEECLLDGESVKIDLHMNFRSRKTVIEGINEIFSIIMTNEIGGADYEKEHKMEYGNKMYDNYTSCNYNMEVLNYNKLNDLSYTATEKEAFIICQDIKNKLNEGYIVFDKEEKNFRKAKYSDFAILIRDTKNFQTFKKIFEYENIPLALYSTESLLEGYNLVIIKNLLKFINKIVLKEYDDEFKHLYLSISRSFLISKNDKEIFKDIINNNIFESELYIKSLKISKSINSITNKELINLIIKEFFIIERGYSNKNIEKLIKDFEFILNFASDLNKSNMYICELINIIDSILDNNLKLEYDVFIDSSNAVKLMTIHKSKGLEFPICYFPILFKKTNQNNLSYHYDDELGLIVPYYENGIEKTFLDIIFKDKYNKQELSEMIRLFYVALTRAREKIIFIDNIDDTKDYSHNRIDKITKYKDILNIIYSKVKIDRIDVDTSFTNITDEYKFLKLNKINHVSTNKILIKELNIPMEKSENLTYSKKTFDMSFEKENLMNMGTDIHEFIEYYDFNSKEVGKYKHIIDLIKKSPLFKCIYDNEAINIYKEYEFLYQEKHGIIDLLIELKDKYVIVDYKTKNIDDINYDKQVSGYIEYIKSITNKPVEGYLYSLVTGNYRLVK